MNLEQVIDAVLYKVIKQTCPYCQKSIDMNDYGDPAGDTADSVREWLKEEYGLEVC